MIFWEGCKPSLSLFHCRESKKMNAKDRHYKPGETIQKTGIVVVGAVGVAGIIEAIIDAAPFWAPLLIF